MDMVTFNQIAMMLIAKLIHQPTETLYHTKIKRKTSLKTLEFIFIFIFLYADVMEHIFV